MIDLKINILQKLSHAEWLLAAVHLLRYPLPLKPYNTLSHNHNQPTVTSNHTPHRLCTNLPRNNSLALLKTNFSKKPKNPV